MPSPLVDRQIELYNTLPVRVDLARLRDDPHGQRSLRDRTRPDSTIPSSTGQITGAAVPAGSCTTPTTPQASCATQTVTGPDGRTYRLDTYIVSVTPPTGGSRPIKQVTVVARNVKNGVVGAIIARAQSAYDPCNPPPATIGTTC